MFSCQERLNQPIMQRPAAAPGPEQNMNHETETKEQNEEVVKDQP